LSGNSQPVCKLSLGLVSALLAGTGAEQIVTVTLAPKLAHEMTQQEGE
jgi:hypothetical protein